MKRGKKIRKEGLGYRLGQRVELHPGTDRWMMGDRYGTVVAIGRDKVAVHLDKSGKKIRFSPDRLTPVD